MSVGVGPPRLVQKKSSRQTSATNGTVTLDAVAKAGNLLVMLVGITSLQTDGTPGPGSWAKDQGTGSVRLHVYSKTSDGTEQTCTHVVGASSTFSTHVYEWEFPGHTTPSLSASPGPATFTTTTSGTTGSGNALVNTVVMALFEAGGSIVAGSPAFNNSFTLGESQTEGVTGYRIMAAADATLTVTWGTWTTNRTGNCTWVSYAWSGYTPRRLAAIGVT